MGQQQLLLVILVTIIVGIATVVAINTFGAAADQANIDAVRQDLATIGAAAQGFYMRPTMLGGGGRTFTDFTFLGLAVPGNLDTDEDDGETLENENGTYTFTATAQLLTITATPASEAGAGEDGRTILARICADGMDQTALGESTFLTTNCN
jgi:Tfp pilus assembly protein PilE